MADECRASFYQDQALSWLVLVEAKLASTEALEIPHHTRVKVAAQSRHARAAGDVGIKGAVVSGEMIQIALI